MLVASRRSYLCESHRKRAEALYIPCIDAFLDGHSTVFLGIARETLVERYQSHVRCHWGNQGRLEIC